MSPRKGRSERRVQILEALHRCLLEKPFHQTSIKEIAREAGVNHGLLHYYFESKEDVLLHYIEYTFDKYFALFEARFASRFGESAVSIDTFEARYRWMLHEIAFNNESARIFTEIWALALYNPTLMKILRKHYESWKSRIFALVKNFVADDAAAGRLSLTLIAISEGMSLFSIFFDPRDLCTDIDFKGLLSSLEARIDL